MEFNEQFVDQIMPDVKKLLETENDFRTKMTDFGILRVNIVNTLIKLSKFFENIRPTKNLV